MSLFRSILLTLLIATVAGSLGAYGGVRYALNRAQSSYSLEQVVRRDLDLTPEQKQQIEALNEDFEAERQALEAEMRAANADLARVWREDHAYTPRVQAATDRFHTAMGTLQKASINHVIAIRARLTPAQAARFDESVAKALTQDPS